MKWDLTCAKSLQGKVLTGCRLDAREGKSKKVEHQILGKKKSMQVGILDVKQEKSKKIKDQILNKRRKPEHIADQMQGWMKTER